MPSMTEVFTIVSGGVLAAVFLKLTLFKDRDPENVEKKPLPVAPPRSKFVELPKSGLTLRYVDDTDVASGSDKKRVIFLLLHGFAGVAETWEFLTPRLLGLQRKARVIALDLPGSGFSNKPEGATFDYAYRSQGRVVSEFISVLGLSHVVVVGHSSGSVVAASAALQSRERVEGAVFVANALFRPKSALFSAFWLRPLFRWMVAKMMADRRKSLERMHSPAAAKRVLTDDFVEKFDAPTRLPGFHAALTESIMAREAPYDSLVDDLLLLPSLSNPPMPMLFVFGKDDTYRPIPAEQKVRIQQKIDANVTSKDLQKVAVVELEECHHYAQHEQPEALAKEILAFVAKNMQHRPL